MATKVFNHGTSDLATAGNWTGGTLPATGDDAIIPKGAQATLTCSATQAAVNLLSLYIDELCDSVVCSSGAPYIISTQRAHFRGKGNLFWQNGATSSAGQNIIVDQSVPATGVIPVVEISGGTVTNMNLQCLRGNITIPSSGAFARCLVSYRNSPSGDVRLTINSAGGVLTLFDQRAGVCTLHNEVTNYHGTGGTCTKDTAKIDNIYARGSNILNFNTIGTTQAILEVGDDAIVDLLQSQTGGVKTFTRTWLMNRCQFRYLPNSVFQVFTNPIVDLRQQVAA